MMKSLFLFLVILLNFLYLFPQTTFIVKKSLSYGENGDDLAFSVVSTLDGGYIVVGSKTSNDSGNKDAWILKFNKKDKLQWQKVFGSKLHDNFKSVVQTTTGYIAAGMTQSTASGLDDIWAACMDNSGILIWQKTYGGEEDDDAVEIISTSDGGCVVVANTWSNTLGKDDILIQKLDVSGDLQWQKYYGGFARDNVTSVIQTEDSGFVVGGYTESKAGGEGAVWLLKLDSNGNLIWDKLFGIGRAGNTSSVIQTTDGDYVIAGYVYNANSNDLDMWVFKIDKDGVLQWDKTYGGTGDEVANQIIQTQDKSFVIAGYTTSKGLGGSDFWIIELDENGNLIREITFGTPKSDYAYGITQIKSGDYIVVGAVSDEQKGKQIRIVRLKR